ncbi:MAG: glycosyltransferase family 4 protein [Bryobacteraceae bacterium]|nr:glycosyltransferase family 4 protein [Bryobacteraceae bacterium]
MSRLLQYHPSVAGRDAVGNEIVALHRAAQSEGIDARIYALDPGSAGGIRIDPAKLLDPAPGDTLLFHFSLGCASFDRLASTRCRRLMVYHDVTPPDLLAGSPPAVVEAARQGLRQAGPLSSGMHAVAAHSFSSAASLSAAGGPGCDLLPYLMRQDLLDRQPDQVVLAEAQLQGRTMLAAGRVLPHKRIEDILLVFDHLRRISPNPWRLVVAGSLDGAPGYVDRLRELCGRLGLPRVVFTGSIPQDRLNAWYRASSAFITMSAHEGFCVPLAEAMHHRLPVFALASAAVPETMRGAGVLFDEPDWPSIAEAIDQVDREPALRARILEQQDVAVRTYGPSTAAQKWLDWLRPA